MGSGMGSSISLVKSSASSSLLSFLLPTGALGPRPLKKKEKTQNKITDIYLFYKTIILF